MDIANYYPLCALEGTGKAPIQPNIHSFCWHRFFRVCTSQKLFELFFTGNPIVGWDTKASKIWHPRLEISL